VGKRAEERRDLTAMADYGGDRRWHVGRRRTGPVLALLAGGLAGVVSVSPAGATGFHCPGTPGTSSVSFGYEVKVGSKGPMGASSPTKAFKDFLRGGSDGRHFPLTAWTHPSKNVFLYDGVHGRIQVTTFRTRQGSYLVGSAEQTCSTF
jgi:hypothetical protein